MSLASQAADRGTTPSAPTRRVGAATRRRADDRFFSAMAIFSIGAVFLGFARTYYLAGIYHAHLRDALIAVHGAAFTAWIVLFALQTGLVARRRVALHRRLGVFGAVLAVAMIGLGLTAATESLALGFAPPGFPFGARVFYVRPVFAITTFAVLVGAALWVRSNAAAHKRLMLLATIALLGAAVGRWPFDIIRRVPPLINAILDLMVMSIAVFDYSVLRRVHRATIAGGLFLMAMLYGAFFVGLSTPWNRVAAVAERAWRGWH